jgi:DNA-directed RNA polymerase subunit E'/Rpb7
MASSAFVLCKVRHSVSLSPCHAVEPRVGIEQDLTEQLMRYSDPLQGVVLSFSDVQLAKPYGVIVNEMPFIHCKVLAKALVFRPSEGMQLRGVVNKIGSNHVGMLFAGVFNGSVTEAELPKGYVHNYAQDCWYAVATVAAINWLVVIELAVAFAKGLARTAPPSRWRTRWT